jgi:SulP family sulfate permease
VQYLPLPVVGGYLAYIGLYCLEAGLSLMSNIEVQAFVLFLAE